MTNKDIDLTEKQKRFCEEYIIDLNGAQAAIRSGYSENTAKEIASENLTKPNIQSYLSILMKERNERNKIDADYVLNRLVEIDKMDVLDIMNGFNSIKPINEWPLIWRQFISSIDNTELFENEGDGKVRIGDLRKIKWPDKIKNLELLGKHINVSAFKENHSLLDKDNKPLAIQILAYTPPKE